MIDIRQEVESMDLILLMPTERFYYKFAWNFIDELYQIYYPGEIQNLLYNYISDIIQNYQWFDLVNNDAGNRGVTMATALRDHAFYQFWVDEEAGKIKKDAAYYVMRIRKDPNWYKQIEEKAKANGRGVEEQMILDGQWMEAQEELK